MGAQQEIHQRKIKFNGGGGVHGCIGELCLNGTPLSYELLVAPHLSLFLLLYRVSPHKTHAFCNKLYRSLCV